MELRRFTLKTDNPKGALNSQFGCVPKKNGIDNFFGEKDGQKKEKGSQGGALCDCLKFERKDWKDEFGIQRKS